MIRLLLILLLIYAGYLFVKNLIRPPEQQVRGRRKDKPVDLDSSNMTDARYKDIEDDR